MKPVIFHTAAIRETRNAILHYEEQRENLGRELRIEIEAAVERLRRNPRAYPLHHDEWTRKVVLRRFPFTIFFVELKDSFWIAAVAHHKRQPDYWERRQPE